jgi:hypothetical protein
MTPFISIIVYETVLPHIPEDGNHDTVEPEK